MSVTTAGIVGRNVRLAREAHGWDRGHLADEAALLDLEWDESTVVSIENGTHNTTVSEFVTLAVLLGVAPHLLLYPEAQTEIAFRETRAEPVANLEAMDDAIFYSETHLPSADFANWLWNPDGHAYTHSDISERELWIAAQSEQQE